MLKGKERKNILYHEDGYKLCLLEKKDIVLYEKALFNAFCKTNPWIMENYILVGKDRLKNFIDYDDITIFLLKFKDDIVASASGHNLSNQEWQAEKIGFSIIDKQNNFEGLNFFVSENYRKHSIEYIITIIKYVKNELKKKNVFDNLLLTCVDGLHKYYQYVGFKIIDTITTIEYKRHLMSLSIHDV